jgi:hypothetical protein
MLFGQVTAAQSEVRVSLVASSLVVVNKRHMQHLEEVAAESEMATTH